MMSEVKYQKRLILLLISTMTALLCFSQSIQIPIQNIRIANKIFVEHKFLKRIDSLQRQELVSKRLEVNQLRWEISKLKENDSLLNTKSTLQYKRQELDSNRIIDLKWQVKQQKKDKLLSYMVATPVAFLVGTVVGILVKTFAIR